MFDINTGNFDRRDLVKYAGGLLLASMVGTSILEPELAEALSHPAVIKHNGMAWYGGMGTTKFTVNGNIGYCVNPSHKAPPNNAKAQGIHDDVIWDSNAYHKGEAQLIFDCRNQLRKCLYCGLEAPGYRREFFPARFFNNAEMTWDAQYACMHILLSDLYALDFNAAVAGTTSAFRTWALNNVTGILNDKLIPGSMRAHLSAEKDGGDWSRFPDPPDSFATFVLDYGWNPNRGENYQRIMTFETFARVSVRKQMAHGSWN